MTVILKALQRANRLSVFTAGALMLLAVGNASGQQQPKEEPSTKFERFLISRGTVRVREHYNIDTMVGRYGQAKFTVARAYTPGQQDFLLALKIDVTDVGRLSTERVGILDAEEVDSLLSAMPQMLKMISVLKAGQNASNTEIDFKAGSIRVGFFMSASTTKHITTQALFVEARSVATATVYFDLDDIQQLEPIIKKAAAKIKELRASQ